MKITSVTLFLLLAAQFAYSQSSRVRFDVEAQAGATTSGHVPFWMRANQYGSVPLSGASGSLIAGAHIAYDTTSRRLFDFSAGAQVRANGGKGSNVTLIEGYGKVRLGIFEASGGRIKEIMGLTDSTLSSGSFAISGNALGIPKVQIAIPQFYTLPILGGILAFKGNFAYGWVGKTPVQYGDTNMVTTKFHQKSLYGRFGMPSWRLKFYGGFNHQVFYGGEKYIWTEKSFNKNQYKLSDWTTYQYVVLGKGWNASRVGNHIGSIDLGLEYDFDKFRLLAYRQTFYEVGGLAQLANIADGLHGLSFTNKGASKGIVRWNKFLLELLYTRNQGGYPWSPYSKSGDQDYYNNYLYEEGWSYKSSGLGTPFISPAHTVREGLPNYPRDYFINNRVIAFHFGTDLTIGKLSLLSKISYSRNFGTFGTTPYGHTTGRRRTPSIYGIFEEVRQVSAYLEARQEIKDGLYVGGIVAFDTGKLLNNAGGAMIKVSQTF